MSSKGKSPAATGGGVVLAPKLRFPEFRKVEAWLSAPMGTVYSFRDNNSLSRDKLNYSSGSIKNIHYGDIHTKFSSHFDITKEHVPFVNDEDLGAVKSSSLCAEGDLILADASEDMEGIGKCIEIINLNAEKLVAGLHTILASPARKQVNPGFGGHLFQSMVVRCQIQREAQGAKVLGISPKRLQDIGLPLPSLPEQQKIADCLDSMDALIAAQGRKVEALNAYKKGLMRQLFPQDGETQPRLRFPEFEGAGEWIRSTIGEFKPFVTSGSRGWAAFYADEGDLFIRITNLCRNSIYLDLRDVKFVLLPTKAIEGTRTKIKKNDVLISITADIGIIGYVDESVPPPAYINQHIALVRFEENQLCSKFVAYFLASEGAQRLFQTSTDNGTKAGMNLIGIQNIGLWIPPIPEQQRIADCLTSLDDLINAETRKLDTLKTHKKGMMQQLFPQIGEADT